MGQINLTTNLKRIAYKDANLYVTSSDIYSKIPYEMVIHYASENSGIPKAQMASAFYALNQTVEQFLLNGHSIELMLLGCLYLSVNAKAVEDEEDAGAKAVKRVSVKFRQSKKLREKINSNVQLVNSIIKKQEGSSSSQDDNDEEETGGSQSSQNGQNSQSSIPTLTISKTGDGTATVKVGGNAVTSGSQIAANTQVDVEVMPATGQTPTATIGSETVTLTNNEGTYTGTFQMPASNATLVIDSGSAGGGVDQN